MKEVLYYTILFDIYGELLTKKQQAYFKDYYFDNLSLSEIAENYEVSKNAIHNQLKDVKELLTRYEESLKILQRQRKLEELYLKVGDEKIKKEIENIMEI